MKWPAHGVAVRLAAKHADKIRKAFRSAFDADAIALSWAETHPMGGTVTPQQARDWAKIHITTDKKALVESLAPLYADGYVIGETAATYTLAHLTGYRKSPTTRQLASASVVDWNTWTPGNRAAALLLKPKGGLESLMATRNVTIDGVTATKLDRIGTVLSKALEQGVTPQEVSIMVDQIINDPEQALMIAQTEMSRAVSVASRDLYETSGVEYVEWLVAEGCADCQDNADASPIRIDDTFPSGDSEPPAHPNCMCSLAPYIMDTGALNDQVDNYSGGAYGDSVDVESIDLAASPTMLKFVPGELEVERALSRAKILPNPITAPPYEDLDKLVESPWKTIDPITVNPNIWDRAELSVVQLDSLVGTDAYLHRKKLKQHIKVMGQATSAFRSFALVVERDGQLIIIDGHHRLMAMWLLGNNAAPVWLASENKEK